MPLMWVDPGAWRTILSAIQRIDAQIGTMHSKLNQLLKGQQQLETTMAIDFTAANAEIARNTDVTGSVKALLASLAQQIADLKTASTDPATQASIDDLVASLKANDDDVAAAVTANTPADPNAPAA